MENLNIEIMKITDLDGVYEVEKNSLKITGQKNL